MREPRGKGTQETEEAVITMDKKELVYTIIHTVQSVCLFILLFPYTDNTFRGEIPSDICILIGVAGLVVALLNFALVNYCYLKLKIHNYKTLVLVSTLVNLLIVAGYFIRHFLF